jgi:ABC-2 type transport system permease protein
MQHLLKIEWMKLKPSRGFWTLFLLFIISIFSINLLVYNFTAHSISAKDAKLLIGAPFSFPEVWQNVSYISGFLLFLPGILMITIITNEYSFRTHRQNIIDGITRSQFIKVKYLVLLLLSVVFTLAVFICALLFGLLNGASISFTKVYYIGYFFLQCITYSSIALLFGFLFKKTGLAIGLFFVYAIVLERMLSGIANMGTGSLYLGNYLPLTSADRLITFPFAKELSKEFMAALNLPLLLAAVTAYLVFYYFFILTRFRKQDL